MLDSDLAILYGVPTKSLNLAVRRNKARFPERFMFRLSPEEAESLRFQFETSKHGRGGRRYLPYAFTEHGVAMLSAVLRSRRAVQMSIAIIDAFVRLREMIASDKELAARMEKVEAEQSQLKVGHSDHASVISRLVEEIKSIKALPESPKRRIGFHAGED